MSRLTEHRLSRRQRQIMDIIHRLGRVTAAEVQEALPDAPTYTAVRTLLTILENDGMIQHIQEGRHYVYSPVQARQSAARSALHQVIHTFFGGSVEQVVTTLLSDDETQLSGEQIARLTNLIEATRADEEASKKEEASQKTVSSQEAMASGRDGSVQS